MLTLPSELLLLIYEHLKDQPKALRQLTATCLQLRLSRVALARVDEKKVGQLNFIMEVDRLRLRQRALRKVLRSRMEAYGSQGNHLTKLKRQALGLDKPPMEDGGAKKVQLLLVVGLKAIRGMLNKFTKQVRAEIRGANALYGDIAGFLKAFEHNPDGTDEKLRKAVERAYSAQSSKTLLAKEFGDLDRCLIRPFNDCIDACNALQLKGVPKKITGW